MPLAAHRTCGILLNQVVIAAERCHAARELAKYALGTLDDWVMREYGHDELDMETLDGLYVRAILPPPDEKLDARQLLDMLEAVKLLLVEHYPDGKALRGILRDLILASAAIAERKGKTRGGIDRCVS